MCKTSPEKVAPPEIVTDRRFRPNLGCSRGDNDPNFFHTPRRVPSYVARHTAKNGRQCHSFLTPFPIPFSDPFSDPHLFRSAFSDLFSDL
jgi:hypothetical protein